MLNAVVSHMFGLTSSQFAGILRDCDLPTEKSCDRKVTRSLNSKGFWRIDKESNPEVRQTVLSLVALHQLEELGLEAFVSQMDGEGWMIPDLIRLADFGLGRDARAEAPQPAALALGPRLLPWQLEEDVARSWEECVAHAQLIRRIVPLKYPTEDEGSTALAAAAEPAVYKQGGLF